MPCHVILHTYPRVDDLNSVSGLVSTLWYRSPFDQLEQSKAKIPRTELPKMTWRAFVNLVRRAFINLVPKSRAHRDYHQAR